MSIRESCSCGAAFSVDHSALRFVGTSDRTGYRNVSEEDAVRAWRQTHRHEQPHRHEWVETTTVSSPTAELQCSGCGQTRTEPRTTEVTGQ